MSHNKNYIKLINSITWRRIRHYQLTHHPLCERCLENGIVTSATEVHHARPVESVLSFEGMKSLAYDTSNLMSLCNKCHHDIHKEMESHSKASIAKNNKRKTDQFMKRYFGE